MTAQVAFVDGRIVSADDVNVSWDAPGFRQGFGLFETIRIAAGRAFLAGAHAQRMTDAAPRLGIQPWLHPRSLARGIDRLVERSGIDSGAVRVFLMPGSPPPGEEALEGLGVAVSTEVSLEGRARYLGALSDRVIEVPRSVAAILAPDLRDASGPLVGLKTISYAGERLLLALARQRGAQEALRRNLAGRVTEGTRANLFVVEGARLLTPPLSEGLLPGVTRWLLLRIARECGLDPVEEVVALDRLLAAEEAFLTSTLRGVVPLVSVEEQPIGSGEPGPVSIRLRSVVEKLTTRGGACP
jgi:branched-subunit amino acid aminotransferase/4-amino-4-deoxychorismate lyase